MDWQKTGGESSLALALLPRIPLTEKNTGNFFRLRFPLLGLIATCFVCILIAGTDPAHGLDPNKRLTQYRHSVWRVQDGLSPNNPYWYCKGPTDIYGPGVQRLDCSALTAFPLSPWSSALSTQVSAIPPSKRNDVVTGTVSTPARFTRYDPGNFTSNLYVPDES